jgi:L-alanine-DL-glutamate epimerase-like enolase superfamily enzyme
MILRPQPVDLRMKHAFTIARGSRTVTPSVIVELEHDGIVGTGEASPSQRYGESVASVLAFLREADLGRFDDPMELESILTHVGSLAPGNMSAKAAIDIALHDWVGKKLGLPLWKWWGLDPAAAPATSFTIGIATPELIGRKVGEASHYPVLKVKLGIPGDEEIVRRIRELTGKTLRVDANEGWKTKEEARDKILWLQEQGVELVEQPLPASQLEETAWLRGEVSLPIIADENVTTSADIAQLRHAFDGINIKLMKCGGLREARKMIVAAKEFGMKVMLGCMIESSVAISAAAQLAPLADYADLDGNLLIDNDPFTGVREEEGKLLLGENAGVGVTRRV